MGDQTRRGIGVVAAAGLAITGVVVASSWSASGAEIPEATDPVYEPFGTLTITTGDRDGSLTLDYADGSPSVNQDLVTQQPCNQLGLSPLSGGDLLAFTPIIGGGTSPDFTVQLPDDGIGVNDGTNCGNPAGHIDDDELLEIALGSFLPGDVFASSASVVIEKDFPNSGDLTVGYDGGTQDQTVQVARGVQTVDLVPADMFTSLSLGSTSNKDARGLEVLGGTSFELVTLSDEFEVAVDCGEKVTDIGDPGEIATQAVYVRGANDPDKQDPEVPCEDVGVTVEIEDGDVSTGDEDGRVYWNNAFTSVNGEPQATSGKITITWAGAPASSAGDPTQIDYDAEGSGVYTDALWCDSFTETTDGAGDPLFVVDFPAYAGPGNIGGEAPWCLVSQTNVLQGSQVFRVDTFVGKGDPWGQFR